MNFDMKIRSLRSLEYKACYKKHKSDWKSVLRERCQNRIKENRDSLLKQLRKVPEGEDVQRTLSTMLWEEWENLNTSQRKLQREKFRQQGDNVVCDEASDESSQYEIDDALQMLDQMRQELLEEEQELVAELESFLSYEQQELVTMVDRLQSEETICPLCRKNSLDISNCTLRCPCGMTVSVDVTLHEVNRRLRHCVDEHGKYCDQPLDCCVTEEDGSGSLCMLCSNCMYLSIVV